MAHSAPRRARVALGAAALTVPNAARDPPDPMLALKLTDTEARATGAAAAAAAEPQDRAAATGARQTTAVFAESAAIALERPGGEVASRATCRGCAAHADATVMLSKLGER